MKSLFSFLILTLSLSSFAGVVIIPPTQIEFVLSHDRTKVRKAFVTVRCLRKATFSEMLSNGMEETIECKDFSINGEAATIAEERIDLIATGNNKFELSEGLKIKFSEKRKGHLCISVAAVLEGNYDYQYVNTNDAFSLASYCNVSKLPFDINSYVYNNRRAPTLKSFIEVLSQPIQIVITE